MTPFRAAGASLLISLIIGLPAQGARTVATCSQAYAVLTEVKRDSSVELELPVTEKILSVLTSKNGKVNAVLPEDRMPDSLRLLLETKYGKPAGQAEWERLLPEEQMLVVQTAGRSRGVKFFEDRRVHGLKVKDTVTLDFPEPTSFLGKSYPAGRHEIDVSRVLSQNAVEYMAPSSIAEFSGIELHFRGRYPAGKLSREARKFQELVDSDLKHQHVHIVARLPVEKLQAAPALEATKMGDFFRRVNLFAEIAFIFDRNPIVTVKNETAIFFDNLNRERLGGATNLLYSAGHGLPLEMGDEFKMGWVGIRGSDKYDQPGLWGLEYRNVYKNAHMPFIEQSLDSIQWSMENAQYGIPDAVMRRWVDKYVPKGQNPGDALKKTWYHDEPLFLLAELRKFPAELRAGLDEAKLKEILTREHRRHTELEMLVHNWSIDPLFFEDPSAQARIQAAQMKALREIQDGVSINGAVQDFLWDSGIAKAVASSVHTDITLVSESPGRLTALPRQHDKEKARDTQNATRKFWDWLKGQVPKAGLPADPDR